MKNTRLILAIVLITSVLWYACEDKNDTLLEIDTKGEVAFRIKEMINTENERGKSVKKPGITPSTVVVTNEGSKSAKESEITPSAVVVTIVSQVGDTLYNLEEIPLLNFNDGYFSEPLSLSPGTYRLIEFLVLDETGNTVYATPLEGSSLDYLVTDPLSIDFSVIKDATTEVIPEVIPTEVFVPEDFGYSVFRFHVVDIFRFQLTAFAYNSSTDQLELTTASISISGDGTPLHDRDLSAVTNIITIQDGATNYEITVEKTGYATYTQTFTNAELKGHENNPIEVTLIEVSVPTGTFMDSGQNLGSSDSFGVELGDVDGDGDIDAFVVNQGTQPNKVWINDGTGNFTDSGQSLGNSESRGVKLRDLDGDGDLDAFVANNGQANKVWINDGAGNFTDSGQNLGGSRSFDVSLRDLDGDGDIDAFVANYVAQPNKVWLNDGDANFTDSGQNLGSFATTGVTTEDLDGDGDIDAFVSSYASQYNKVWLNDGDANFTDNGQSLGSSHTRAVTMEDLDGDGDIDAFTVNDGQPNKVWLNDGDANFTDSGQNLGNSVSYSVLLADLDNDSDLDAFVGNNGQNKIWLNDGNANFTDSGQGLGSSVSTGIALGDLDGDGILDVFIANSSSQPNKVWFGQ